MSHNLQIILMSIIAPIMFIFVVLFVSILDRYLTLKQKKQNNKMRKVYCKNCKHIKQIMMDHHYEKQPPSCALEIRKYIDCAGYKQIVKGNYAFCHNKTVNYNCKDYKRKWWKFWIKSDKGGSMRQKLKAKLVRNFASDQVSIEVDMGDGVNNIWEGIEGHCLKMFSRNEGKEIYKQIQEQVDRMKKDDIPFIFLQMVNEVKQMFAPEEEC